MSKEQDYLDWVIRERKAEQSVSQAPVIVDRENSIPVTALSAAAVRKAQPLATGVLAYFPDALTVVAEVSKAGNDQHNPGQPLHWAKEKSTDHADCILRHLRDHLAGVPVDTDGMPHLGKVAWRALALLQIEEDKKKVTK